MLYIGIDLGTSAVKLLLMNATGEIKKIVSKEYPIFFPQTGWSEQNPEDWYNATVSGLKELTADCDTSLINGLSFSGQMHGLVILDKDDQVIRPAILWNDGRTQKECDYLNNEIGREKLSQYTANIALTGFTAPKILWVKNNEPENFSRISKIMLPKDYLAYRLTGNHCTDVSDASGMLLFDVKNKCWSKDMIRILGLHENQLAKIYESSDVIGTVKESIATELHFPSTVKVIIGGGDQAVAAVGTGTVGDGMCNISLGTSGVVFIASKNFAVDDNNALHAFAHADGKYHLMGVTLSAAASNKWWMDEIIGTQDYVTEQKEITKLGQNNVFFLPYLMGERTPHNNPDARGTFIGMTMNTSRSDMTQAVLEGVAYSLRDCLDIARSLGVTIERTRINGGGAKSPLWKKIIANVMNVTVDTINSEEGPAFGAAILACVGCKEYATVEEATSKLIQVVDSIEPDDELVSAYERQYKKFVTLYPALKDVFKIIK
jgi:xylulokinase